MKIETEINKIPSGGKDQRAKWNSHPGKFVWLKWQATHSSTTPLTHKPTPCFFITYILQQRQQTPVNCVGLPSVSQMEAGRPQHQT